MAAIEISDLHFIYGRDLEPVFFGASALIGSGVNLLFGPSGCGKSTLLNLIAGSVKAQSGSLLFRQTESVASPSGPFVAQVFQNLHVLRGRSVRTNVVIGPLSRGFRRSHAEQLAESALRDVNLDDIAHRRCSSLSGGQNQRVAVARAIASQAPIVLADEPTGQLDAESSKAVAQSFRAIPADRIVLVATHDPVFLDFCDRIMSVSGRRLQ